MLRYIYGDDLPAYPELARTMFRDRARQFHDRLHWRVSVDETGAERDAYDGLNPLYVIWQRADGRHGGSLRFLPTTGRCMTHEHFLDLTDGVKIESPLIWECTRFCLAPGASAQVSSALMLGGMEAGRLGHLTHALGVFDARMVRIYRRLGWGPTVLGSRGTGAGRISVGLWSFDEEGVRDRLLAAAGLPAALSENWLRQSLGGADILQAQRA